MASSKATPILTILIYIIFILTCYFTFATMDGIQLSTLVVENEELVFCRDPDGYEVHENCSLYYRCFNGVPELMVPCNDDLYFNPDKNECDRQENVPACQGGTREPPTYTTTPRPICPSYGNHYFPKEGNCEEYILCIDGTPFTLKCSQDMIFDPKEKSCVHMSQYQCPWPERKKY